MNILRSRVVAGYIESQAVLYKYTGKINTKISYVLKPTKYLELKKNTDQIT